MPKGAFLKSYDINDNKRRVRRIQGELTMPKKEVQNYYLKFTDYVEVIYAAYKEPEKTGFLVQMKKHNRLLN